MHKQRVQKLDDRWQERQMYYERTRQYMLGARGALGQLARRPAAEVLLCRSGTAYQEIRPECGAAEKEGS